MLKRDNYINIQAWMITELGLTGNDLMVYAIIYGFSQDNGSVFSGTRSYLAEWCGTSERSVQRNINNLIAKGFIEQVFHAADNRQVHYMAVTSDKMSLVTNCQGASDKMSPVLVTKCHQTSDKMSLAYKDDNIADTITDNIADSIVVCDSAPRARFKKPTREEVKEYSKTRAASGVDPDRFFDYYEANGWKVGKNKMKDWRAAFRMWESREKGARPSGSGAKKPEDVPYMQKEYTKEHLEQKEADSMRVLDDLLGGETP